MKKIILITGSNWGIGFGIAEQYAKNKNYYNNVLLMTSINKEEGAISNYPDI